jgi:4-amino-4-deoxy-L-arabinose transferase-like glycosyltransferase
MQMSTLAFGKISTVIRERRWFIPSLLFLVALIPRLIAWPHSDVVNADAVTRALIGESYMHYPGWSGDGVWPPLHFYLNGLFAVLCGSRVTGTVLVNILLGSAIVFPVFAFVRRMSGAAVAAAVVLIVVFEPLVFRNSLQGLSEVPFLFFTACAFNSLSAAQSTARRASWGHASVAGLFLTVAGGMRYEAWLLIPLLAGILMIPHRWKTAAAFVAMAMIFPIAWMITGQVSHGDPFTGLEQLVHWRSAGVPADISEGERLLRTAFFPVSFLAALSPVIIALGIVGVAWAFLRKRLARDQWPWLMLLPIFMVIMVDKARHGELLLQHRFTMTLVLLFIPYLALGFSVLRQKATMPVIALLLAAWTFRNSFQQPVPVWFRSASNGTRFGPAVGFISDRTIGEMAAVPRLNERWPDELVATLNALHPDKDVGILVLDFFGWQETYNVAFRTDIRATSIVFLPEAQQSAVDGAHHLEDYLDRLDHAHGILVVRENGAYQSTLLTMAGGRFIMPLFTKELLLQDLGLFRNLHLYAFRTFGRDTPVRSGTGGVQQ